MLKFIIILLFAKEMMASPKYDELNFHPINRYQETNLPSIPNNTKPENKEDRLRFGIPLYSGSGSGGGSGGGGVQYGGSSGVAYGMTPMKIDLGGVAIGALIGLGMILLVPKLTNILSGSHGYRSLENEVGSVTDLLAKIDNALEEHNIDSSSCMQRVICNYMNDARKNIQNGEGSTVDQLIVTLANNPLLSNTLDGTAIKQAVDMGKEGDSEKCSALYTKCPISRESVAKVITSFLPA